MNRCDAQRLSAPAFFVATRTSTPAFSRNKGPLVFAANDARYRLSSGAFMDMMFWHGFEKVRRQAGRIRATASHKKKLCTFVYGCS
jgi:hypothetical protein